MLNGPNFTTHNAIPAAMRTVGEIKVSATTVTDWDPEILGGDTCEFDT